ncbi:DUF294 nucleotidyltransferase-like domain-containing protein [Alteromonas flava]|uniref:DUF294 nucleotidyltransferase-like domain-containing protein n=1 Tax=Alteromonas flava TaxID=2048003 RepID=UPI000C28FB3E|nr:DUF294 nucleotidyltransferase-like domain-containing protein [Alteromonas flava]
MSTVPQQISDFLRTSAPFDQLGERDIQRLVHKAKLIYVTEDNKQQLLQSDPHCLYLIQAGQFSVKDSDGPTRHLSDGDYFGISGILDNIEYPITLSVDMPGLIFCFQRDAVLQVLENATVANFFNSANTDALQNSAVTDSNSMWLYKPLSEVISKAPVVADVGQSIGQAAALMAEQNVSSLLITQDANLVGILTDRDLRNRVVARGTDYALSVAEVMTPQPAKITQNRTLFDALSLMTERNIHHLPVIDRFSYQPVGMITASDIVRHQRGNVLFVIGELSKAQNLYDLIRASWQIPHYFSTHAKRAGDFDIAGKVLSQATDIMTRKLITFYQHNAGPAPMAYCWVVYGSQAREDQTLGSDQDNALLLERTPTTAEEHYFAELADYVCQGLNKCGIKLCPGNIMASNPELRLSLNAALDEARSWVKQPTPDAIMHFNIFLDARAAAGDVELFKQLQAERAPLLQNKMFLAALARHTNEINVPLSMFQKFVYEKGRDVKDSIDLKKNAVAIINNLVRLYALESGLKMPATLGRLANLPSTSGLSSRDADNLRDIWLFLNRLRWRHQLTQKVTDNCVAVSELSSIEKHQLKAAFKAIGRAQQAAVMKFSGGVG